MSDFFCEGRQDAKGARPLVAYRTRSGRAPAANDREAVILRTPSTLCSRRTLGHRRAPKPGQFNITTVMLRRSP